MMSWLWTRIRSHPGLSLTVVIGLASLVLTIVFAPDEPKVRAIVRVEPFALPPILVDTAADDDLIAAASLNPGLSRVLGDFRVRSRSDSTSPFSSLGELQERLATVVMSGQKAALEQRFGHLNVYSQVIVRNEGHRAAENVTATLSNLRYARIERPGSTMVLRYGEYGHPDDPSVVDLGTILPGDSAVIKAWANAPLQYWPGPITRIVHRDGEASVRHVYESPRAIAWMQEHWTALYLAFFGACLIVLTYLQAVLTGSASEVTKGVAPHPRPNRRRKK